VFIKDATRDSFCKRTRMTHRKWANARQRLLAHGIIDRDNTLLVAERYLKRGELVH
jgi:hypothetical protein